MRGGGHHHHHHPPKGSANKLNLGHSGNKIIPSLDPGGTTAVFHYDTEEANEAGVDVEHERIYDDENEHNANEQAMDYSANIDNSEVTISSDLLLKQSSVRLKERINHTNHYVNLFQFLFFIIAYFVVLFQQSGGSNKGDLRNMKRSFKDSLFEGPVHFANDGIIDYSGEWDGSPVGYSLFDYDGELFDEGTASHVEYYTDKDLFLKWFARDILDKIFPLYEDKKERFFTPGNMVVVGAMLTTTRTEEGGCKASDFFEVNVCEESAFSNDPYSYDPTFVNTSSVYNFADVTNFYNEGEMRETDVQEDNGTSTQFLPYGFYKAGSSEKGLSSPDSSGMLINVAFGTRPAATPTGYPVIFDRELSRERVSFLLRNLVDGNYIDEKTRSIKASLITYNPKLVSYMLYALNVFCFSLSQNIPLKMY